MRLGTCAALLAAWFTPAPAQDFPLEVGTYLSAEPAQTIGVAIADGAVIVVAVNRNPGSGYPAGSGEIQFWDFVTGMQIAGQTLSGSVRAMAHDANSRNWLAAGDFGVLLSAQGGTTVGPTFTSQQVGGAPSRVALCGQRFAVLLGTQIRMFDLLGQPTGQFQVDATRVADIACSEDGARVYATGDRQVSGTLRMAFLEAYSADGQQQWRAWGWSAAQAQAAASLADTDGRRVLMGSDGWLYFAGRTDGGNNVYRFSPQNLSQNANNIGFDAYNQTFQLSGAPSLAYYARLDPNTGVLQRGQFLLTRLGNGNGNSVGIDALAVGTNGELHVGGQAFASLANRATLSVAGTTVGPYSGSDPYLLVLPQDFQSRRFWHPFVAVNGRGITRAAATRDGIHAFVVDSPQGSLITRRAAIGFGALGFTPAAAAPAAYLGIWGQDRLHTDGFEAPLGEQPRSTAPH